MFWKIIRVVINSEISDIMKIYQLRTVLFDPELNIMAKRIKRLSFKESLIDYIAEKVLDLKGRAPTENRVEGHIDYESKFISIASGLPKINVEITFIHEILHIILKERKLIFLLKFLNLVF